MTVYGNGGILKLWWPVTRNWIYEYAERKTVTIAGQDAILYLNTDDEEHTLVWADEAAGIAFCLEASENEEIMLRVAEAVSAAK